MCHVLSVRSKLVEIRLMRFLCRRFEKVPAHCELMWMLSCTASMGHLARMTQWKVSRDWSRKRAQSTDVLK